MKLGCKQSQVSVDVAKRLLVAGDRQRAAFVLRAMGHNVADPLHYDLVVNTDTYCGERAEAVVLMAYLVKFGEWPLTARELIGERPSGPAGRLPPIGPLADMV